MLFLIMNTSTAGFLDFLDDSNSSGENNDTTLVVGFNPVCPPFVYKDNSGKTMPDLILKLQKRYVLETIGH